MKLPTVDSRILGNRTVNNSALTKESSNLPQVFEIDLKCPSNSSFVDVRVKQKAHLRSE